MAISVADNFLYQGKKPLDARIVFNTLTDMTNMPAAVIYDGCLAYVKSERKYYNYDTNNTADPTLGKWKELETGGGGADNIVEGYFNSADNLFYEESTYTTAITGEAEKIYIDLPNNKTYRFNGTIFTRLDEETFEDIQRDTLPAVSADELGNIYQYTGATSGDLVNGFFYKCVSDGQPTPTYSWEQVNVQPDNEGQTIQYATLPTAEAAVLGKIVQYTGADTATLEHGHFYECTTDGSTYEWTEIDVNDDENQIVQIDTLPSPVVGIAGRIYQYIGTATSDYTNGYFYQCIEDPDNAGTYIWVAKNVQAGSSGGGSLGKAITAAIDVGGIDAGDSFTVGTSYDDMWDALLNPTLYPTFTAPSASLSYSADTYYAVGSTISAKSATLSYNAGAITLNGTKQNNRGGAATNYAIATSGADTEYSDSSTSSGSFSVSALTRSTKGAITITGTVSFSQGPQPLDSKGNNYDSPLAAGSVTATKTMNFILPYYYGKSSTPTVSNFTGLTQSVTAKGTKSFKFTTNNEYMVFAYDSSYGNLSSILDPNSFETISGWTKSTLTVGGFSYYVYVANSATTDTNAQFTFKY